MLCNCRDHVNGRIEHVGAAKPPDREVGAADESRPGPTILSTCCLSSMWTADGGSLRRSSTGRASSRGWWSTSAARLGLAGTPTARAVWTMAGHCSAGNVGCLAAQLGGQLSGGEFDGVAVSGRPVAVIDEHEFTALKLPLNAKLTGGPRAGAKRRPRDVRVEPGVSPRSRHQNPGPWLFQVRRPWADRQPSRVHQQPWYAVAPPARLRYQLQSSLVLPPECSRVSLHLRQ